MNSKPKICTWCGYCDKSDCKQRAPPLPKQEQTFHVATTTVILVGWVLVFLIIALCFFIQGSHQQDNSLRAAWNAYYCSQLILPTSLMIAGLSIVWLIALNVSIFKAPERK